MRFNRYLRSFAALLLLLLGAGVMYAQTTVSGRVTSDGEPVEGATVIVKGTTSGAFTDENGDFSVTAPRDIETLVIRYINTEKEVAVAGRSSVNVEIGEAKVLDEVVVTGYTTARSKEVTSAITSVKAEDFNRGNVNDATQFIQGKVPGLVIARPGGDPNGNFTIRLRGLSSLGQNQQPLIIIDGVLGASLQTLDPNDIQSMDVLKDGSAAAIYGTRGSAGVIIITTKKGLPNSSSVEYNGYVTAENIAKRVETFSAQEFTDFVTAKGSPQFNFGGNTDWLGEVTRQGLTHVHNLSMSGGSRSTTYRASVNYRDVQGVARESGFNQINGRLNLVQKAMNNRLTLTSNLSITSRDAEFGFTEALRYATLYNPTAPVMADPSSPLYDKYGGYFQSENFDFFNPVAILEQSSNEGRRNDLLASLRAEYQLFDGFKVGAFYSQQRVEGLNGQYFNKQAYFRGFNRNGLAERSTNLSRQNLFEATADYNKKFGDLGFKALGGYSFQQFDNEGMFARGGNFISDALGYNALGLSQDFPRGLGEISSYANQARLIAFFGQAEFNLDDTYYLRASGRYEGSSTFGADNKWGFFPAVSAGVTLSNLFDVSSIDNLKLRVGYGVTGALPGESYLSLFRFDPVSNFFYNGNFVPAFGPTQNPNPNLGWERKSEINAGIDFALLNYKLTGSLDVYQRTTNDLLYRINVPVPPNQAPTTVVNLNNVALKNSGFEFSIGYAFENGSNFKWEPRLLLSSFSTLLDSVAVGDGEQVFAFSQTGELFDPNTSPGAPGLNNNPTIRVKVGEPLGQIWGFKFAGVADNGKYIFEDLDGNGTIDDRDRTVIGNGLPKFSMGFNNSFKFGDIDFNFFLRGDFGHDLANMYRLFYEPRNDARLIENKVNTSLALENLTDAPQFSDLYVERADYVVLDNASVGYNFKFEKGKAFQTARISLAGQNLFFLTNYTGVDPSPRFTDSGDPDNGGYLRAPNPLAPGLDRRMTYYRTRSFTLSVNLGF